MISRDDVLKANIRNLIPRDSRVSKKRLKNAYKIYCSKLRGRHISNEENEVLTWCTEHSCLPILPAFFDLRSVYPGFQVYSMGPSDMLHTLIGFLEYFASSSVVCIAECGKIPKFRNRYGDNIGRLDAKIANIPLKYGVPVQMKHFKDGISAFVGMKGNRENEKRSSGMGHLGMIDSQDVPDLVLQLLLCKWDYVNIDFSFKH